MDLKVFMVDTHIHTCLSPCAELDMHPAALIDAAVRAGLDSIAVCDHNSAENAAAVQRAGLSAGLPVIPGMEITSAEDVHILGLLPDLEAAMALQAWLGIATDVNTLPVQVIGVGIGVDYGIYIVDRIRQERRRGLSLPQALAHAVGTTGLAVTFTATTLVLGIAFWIPISSLRFSAEMSLLLTVLMAVNALGALLLVPALIRVLPERWTRGI